MRRTSLDELPQMLNVLRGQMSIVGPRPHALRTTAGGKMCEEVVDRYSRRHRVKPGVTGWAQIRSGYAADCDHMAEKLSYDLWYIRNRTLLLDIAICAKTCLTLLSGTGAR